MRENEHGAALAWIAGGIGWTLTALIGLRAAKGSAGFYFTEMSWIAVHVLVLIGLVALLRTGATAGRRWGQAGITLAAIARVLFIGLEIISIAIADDQIALFPVAVVGTGLGMLLGGLALLRAHQWSGWSRFAALAMGAYPFVAIVPVFAVTGSRPPDALIAGWGLAITAVGLTLLDLRESSTHLATRAVR